MTLGRTGKTGNADVEFGNAPVKGEGNDEDAQVTTPVAAPVTAVKMEAGKKMPTPARRVQPLASLNPYQECWTVCAKVTKKSALRTYTNARGEGSVFDVELVDTEGTAIRATLWRGVADKYYETMEEGAAFYVSNGVLKPANRNYSSVKNDYEMTLTERSRIERVEEDALATRLTFKVSYDFVKIKDLSAYIGRKKMLDVVGVAVSVGQVGSVKRKTDGASLLRRDITIVDEDALTVTVTLWGPLAEEKGSQLEDAATPRVVIIRGARVTDFNGVSLSTVSRSEMLIEPDDVDEAAALRSWYDENGNGLETKAAGEGLATGGRKSGEGKPRERKQLQDFPAADALTDAPMYFNNVIATVTKVYTNGNMHWKAAPESDANGKLRKVVEDGQGRWVCDAIGKTYDSFKRQYILNAMLADATGEVRVNMFNAEGELLFGMTSDEVRLSISFPHPQHPRPHK